MLDGDRLTRELDHDDFKASIAMLGTAVARIEKRLDALTDSARGDDRHIQERLEHTGDRLADKIQSVSERVSGIEGRIQAYRELCTGNRGI